MKPRRDLSQYKKVDYAVAALQSYFDKGYKVFNLYHFRKSDELMIQLKDGKGDSATVRFKCTYPIYKFPIQQLRHQENIFHSMYFMKHDCCDKVYVPSDIINEIGKLDSKNKQIDQNYNPERFLVYNVLRPEYYVSTALKPEHMLTFEETRICSFDIEIVTVSGKFPEPSKAEEPIGLATVFDFQTVTANVFYLNGNDIDDYVDNIMEKLKKSLPEEVFNNLDLKINLLPFDEEKLLISSMMEFMNDNFDIALGWYVNEFDFAYIVNRAEKLEMPIKYGMIYDGFTYGYIFENFICIDLVSVYKFFVKKNPSSTKLSEIAFETIKIRKIETETFLDIAYNIGDTLLLYLMEQKLSLMRQMFSFKENGALLHVFNVRNALEPLILKHGAEDGGSFIANQYTIYYNIYYNEIYKLINRRTLKLQPEECHFFSKQMKNVIHFLTHLSQYEPILKFYMDKSEDKKEEKEAKEDSAGTVLAKMVEKIFKKKRKKKDGEPEKEEIDISSLAGQKSFDYENEDFDDILCKLYGINIDTIYGYPGAFNKSFRGVSDEIIDLDFFSMYPVIIYSLNISIETAKFLAPMKLNILKVYDRNLYVEFVNSLPKQQIMIYDLKKDSFHQLGVEALDKFVYTKNHIVANSGMIFDKNPGFIPSMCAHFLEVRAKYKSMMKSEADPVKKGKYNIFQLLYKVYNNSIYGYMGYKYSVLFNRLLVSSVTIMGRSEILFANHEIISYLGDSDDKVKSENVSITA